MGFTSPTCQRGNCRNVFPRSRFGLVWGSKQERDWESPNL